MQFEVLDVLLTNIPFIFFFAGFRNSWHRYPESHGHRDEGHSRSARLRQVYAHVQFNFSVFVIHVYKKCFSTNIIGFFSVNRISVFLPL